MFSHLKAFKRLKELAKSPFDLSKLDSHRVESMRLKGNGLNLFFGTEAVDDEILDALFALARESKAPEKMRALQEMQLINKLDGVASENRRVGHTAIRAEHPLSEIAAEEKRLHEIERAKIYSIRGKFRYLVVNGIGGSFLGTKALYSALKAYGQKDLTLLFASSLDPDSLTSIFRSIEAKETLFVTVSKSGTTLETLVNEAYIRKRLSELGLDPLQHLCLITERDGPLDKEGDYLARFTIGESIGGRFSASSMVGAVPLTLLFGEEMWNELVRGLSDMDHHALAAPPEENLPLMGALLNIWNRNFLELSSFAVIPYSQALIDFPAHLQQLFMESLGKQVLQEGGKEAPFATGALIWGSVGTECQHSYFQAIHQGTDRYPIEFIATIHSQYGRDSSLEMVMANLFAQSIALAKGEQSSNPNKSFPGNRPSRILLMERVTPYTLGNLLAYYEHVVAFQSFIWGINAFDQEGVQLGKRLALEIIKNGSELYSAFKGSYLSG